MGHDVTSHGRTYRGVDTEQRRAERRERLVEAALDEFTSRGYHKTKVAELCAQAGVSTRNFYEKFASKEALLLELHAQINTIAMKRMLALLDSLANADVVTRITTLVDEFVATVTSDPRFARLNYVEAPGTSPAMERQHQDWVNRYTDFIEAEANRAAEAGLLPKRDFHLTAIAMVGAITGVLREWQAHEPPLPAEDVASEIRAIIVAALTRPVDQQA